MDRHEELMALAARLWTAAESLEAIRGGGDAVWAWTHERVAELTRQGRQEVPEAVRELVHVVEGRLAMERDRRGEVEA